MCNIERDTNWCIPRAEFQSRINGRGGQEELKLCQIKYADPSTEATPWEIRAAESTFYYIIHTKGETIHRKQLSFRPDYKPALNFLMLGLQSMANKLLLEPASRAHYKNLICVHASYTYFNFSKKICLMLCRKSLSGGSFLRL